MDILLHALQPFMPIIQLAGAALIVGAVTVATLLVFALAMRRAFPKI